MFSKFVLKGELSQCMTVIHPTHVVVWLTGSLQILATPAHTRCSPCDHLIVVKVAQQHDSSALLITLVLEPLVCFKQK
jgi:hypothetical protein